MKVLLFCCLLVACVKADSVLDDFDAQSEAKTFFTSGGTYYLALNTTYLIYYGILLGIGVMALIAITQLGGDEAAHPYSSNNQYRREGDASEEEFYHDRQRRAAHTQDVATKLAQLDSALKKYQVEEAECELFIACEASQVHRLEENGPLAKIVNEIFSTMNPEKNYPKMTDRMANLFQSFQYGTNAYQSGQYDACQPLRNKCFELHARTN